MSQLTCDPIVYGIISQSPLFKVAFPDAMVIDNNDLRQPDLRQSDLAQPFIDNIVDTQGAHNELYPNGSTMQ